MSRKKKQSSKKKKSTYKPKWAKEKRIHKKTGTSSRTNLIIPTQENEDEKVVVSNEKLPMEYNPPDNLAYTFPPFFIVVVLFFIILLLVFLLY